MNQLATDQEIQEALHQLFKSNPRGVQCPQGQSILTNQCPQGTISSTNDKTSPQGNFGSESKPSVIAATVIPNIQFDHTF